MNLISFGLMLPAVLTISVAEFQISGNQLSDWYDFSAVVLLIFSELP